MNRILWFIFIFFAIGVGVYPLSYWMFDMSGQFLSAKPGEVLSDAVWNAGFYLHLTFGGIAMLTGWSQFIDKIRIKRMGLHRTLGKIYIASVLISGLSALYIAFYATGGLITSLGFSGLAVAWLATTVQSFLYIRRKNISQHKNWMIRSYALTFAAVTLRIWLPLLQVAFALDFLDAYRVVSWLCWIPNLVFAEILVRNRRRAVLA